MSEPAIDKAPSARTPKPRSCVVCRSRKVRCDKQSPCANCRRANISCVFPSTDRPPRWARRLQQLNANDADSTITATAAVQNGDPNAGNVMNRLQNLESLVKELRGQLADANTASSASAGSGAGSSPESFGQTQETEHQTKESTLNRHFGRMVIQDPSRSQYVTSGFWSRIDDELAGLKADTLDLSEDESDTEDGTPPNEAPPPGEPGGAGSNPYAFMFRQSSNSANLSLQEFHPLPSQVPFLLDTFDENVNIFFRTVHMPSTSKMARSNSPDQFNASNEALLFSVYYAAIASMEEDDVMTNFGSPKADLTKRYRLGLELAFAKADFLNEPDLTLVQAFMNFLLLARRHENPRFVWMMTGLLLRMTTYLGLQRDGSHFKNLSSFDIEIRRRLFWAACLLDMRASEDQGTDVTIISGSFDTKIPLNINEADISPDSKQVPIEHYGVTDMSFARITAATTEIMRKMTQMSARGGEEGVAALGDQSRLRNEFFQQYENEYFQFTTGSNDIATWVARCVSQLVMAKMELIIYLPALQSSAAEDISDEIRTKLLVSAIEVAEYNHMLNAEPKCAKWRWVYQTHTHWHSIVYILIEVSRRSWSPMIERAWVALHSNWLIPSRAHMNKSLRLWIPLRRLMDKAGKHRDFELQRLRADPVAAAKLEAEERFVSLPSSSGPFSEKFRERWRELVDGSTAKAVDWSGKQMQTSGQTRTESNAFDPTNPVPTVDPPRDPSFGRAVNSAFDILADFPMEWSGDYNMGPGFEPSLWPEVDTSTDLYMGIEPFDANIDFIEETNWLDWVQSATNMERHAGSKDGNA